VIWYSTEDGDLLLRTIGGTPSTLRVGSGHVSVSARWWAAADRVVWATVDHPGDPEQATIIHLARVRGG
jgi:hypothetical protein